MKIRHIGPKKSILILLVGTLICWEVVGIASEPWNSKTSARVNLRRNPSSDGVILSIVPKGHKVRIIEKQGPWCKVDVEGEIHGKGWVYAEYVEEIIPIAPETEPAFQTVRKEIASGVQKQGIHPANPPPKDRMEGKKENLLNPPPPEKVARAGATEQASIRSEFRGGDDKSIAISKGDVPMVEKPVHIPPIPSQRSDINNETVGVIEKASSGVPIQRDIFPSIEKLPDKRQEPGTAGQRKSLGVKERTMSISPALEEEVIQRLAESNERKGPIHRPKSIGLVELTLKLLSIALSCLVILLLYRANKIASNRYHALKQIQHHLDTRQHR